MKQDLDSDGGKWFVEQDQMTTNAYFICQSPKIPKVSSSAPPIMTHFWSILVFAISVYMILKMLII